MRTPAKTPAATATGFRGATLARQCKRCGETFDTYAVRPRLTCPVCLEEGMDDKQALAQVTDPPYREAEAAYLRSGGHVPGFDYAVLDEQWAEDDE